MTKIIIASHNKHKIKEMQAIFNHPDVILVSLNDLNDQDEVEENGSTFEENALLKAKYYAQKYHEIAISDDSGLVVPALDGRPGIYSARYSGNGDHEENNIKILDEMKNEQNREAYFVSVIVLCYPNGRYLSYEGRAYGKIADQMKGSNGFGYDSIFIDPLTNLHFAELSSAHKNTISHRSKALAKLKEDIDEILNHK